MLGIILIASMITRFLVHDLNQSLLKLVKYEHFAVTNLQSPFPILVKLTEVVACFYSLSCFYCMRVKQATQHKFQMSRQSIFHRGVTFFFKKNLLLTNSITSGLCMAVGDLVQQEIEFQRKLVTERYDWARTGRMLAVGMAMGPLHHYYYVNLDKHLPKTDLKTVSLKILCDQAVASPSTIMAFFFAMGFLENKTFPEITSEIQKKFLYAYMGDCMYWPPVQFINFYFLHPQYRVVYINVATMVFNIFLSYVKHYDQKH